MAAVPARAADLEPLPSTAIVPPIAVLPLFVPAQGIQAGGGAVFNGGTLGGQITWSTGLGAITHILGPTDQPLLLTSNNGGTQSKLSLANAEADLIGQSVGIQMLSSGDAYFSSSNNGVWFVCHNDGGCSLGTTAVTPPANTSPQGNGNLSLGAPPRVAGVAHVFRVTADFTTASASLVTVTGLTWTMPVSIAENFPFRCVLQYSQATAAAANLFGIQGATTAPTNLQVSSVVYTSATAFTAGTATITTTTATTVVTATPSAIATVWRAEIDGLLEAPSNASPTVLSIQVATGNVADSLTIKRGSFCIVN